VVVKVNEAFNNIVVDYMLMMLHLRNGLENDGTVAGVNNELKLFSESRLKFMPLRRELHQTCQSFNNQKHFEVFHHYFMLVDSIFYSQFSMFEQSISKRMLYCLNGMIDLNPDDRKRLLEQTISLCEDLESAFEEGVGSVAREYAKLNLKFHANPTAGRTPRSFAQPPA
jgi:hypothetical protein